LILRWKHLSIFFRSIAAQNPIGVAPRTIKRQPCQPRSLGRNHPLFANKVSRTSFGRGALCIDLHRVVIRILLTHEIRRVDNQRLLLCQRLRAFGDLARQLLDVNAEVCALKLGSSAQYCALTKRTKKWRSRSFSAGCCALDSTLSMLI
jgi:hypothetical protein